MAQATPFWTVDRHDSVVVAAFSNPPMNYLTTPAVAELRELIEGWYDPEVRAVVLTGASPGRFITHFSVEELLSTGRDRERLIDTGTAWSDAMHRYRLRLLMLPKPVIAAMNGDTMGGGLELSLACDIRIGERGDYRYGLPEVRLGIMPGGTGTQRLPRLVGLGAAVDMILRGRLLTPEEALSKGLVHELAVDARARATELARDLAKLSPRGMAMIKRSLYEGSDVPLGAGLRIEANALLETRLSAEAEIAMEEYVSIPLPERRDWLEGLT
jgi:enoyl-CoA hydratase/carnithine racemase